MRMRGILARGFEPSSPCSVLLQDLGVYSRPQGLWRKTEKEEVNQGNLLLETRTCGYVTVECGLTWIKVIFMRFFLLRFFLFVCLFCFTAVALSMLTVLSHLTCVTMSVRSC